MRRLLPSQVPILLAGSIFGIKWGVRIGAFALGQFMSIELCYERGTARHQLVPDQRVSFSHMLAYSISQARISNFPRGAAYGGPHCASSACGTVFVGPAAAVR